MTVTNEVGPAETPSANASREQNSRLFERVRALFGMAPASARDDIEDALEESASGESPGKNAPSSRTCSRSMTCG